MVEYRKTFLNEIKLLLSCFMEFSDNRFMLSNVYPDNYAVKKIGSKTYHYNYP